MLYHYTDFAAFDGIIRCAELRLNNILNMNDASEMRFFMNGICRAVMERLKAEGEEEKSHVIEKFFHRELEEEFRYSAYAACFSKYRDDAAQWERYGHLGQGVQLRPEDFPLVGGFQLPRESVCLEQKDDVAPPVLPHPILDAAEPGILYGQARLLIDFADDGIHDRLMPLHMAAGKDDSFGTILFPVASQYLLLHQHLVAVVDHAHIRKDHIFRTLHFAFVPLFRWCFMALRIYLSIFHNRNS